MKSLELKIPPPLVTLLFALLMWAVARLAPVVEMQAGVRTVSAIVLALAGVAISFAGMRLFRRASTTVSPTRPQAASTLVTTGIYRVTRNPMYLGLVCVLVAWAVFLSSAWSLLGPLGFVLYMTRFQIKPEERILARLFGPTYSAWCARVRRWL